MLVFEERGKPEYPEKTFQSKGENQQQTQPTYGVHAGPDWWDASAIPFFSLSHWTLARHDLPVPSVQIDSGVWSEVLDWEKLNHDEKRKRKLGSLDLTPYPTPDVFPAHVSLHRPRNLSYTGRFAMTIFSVTQRCNLFPFETWQQRCNAVLR